MLSPVDYLVWIYHEKSCLKRRIDGSTSVPEFFTSAEVGIVRVISAQNFASRQRTSSPGEPEAAVLSDSPHGYPDWDHDTGERASWEF
jgi:hypothetical protein